MNTEGPTQQESLEADIKFVAEGLIERLKPTLFSAKAVPGFDFKESATATPIAIARALVHVLKSHGLSSMAAPQAGLDLAVIAQTLTESGSYLVAFNPRVVFQSANTETLLENSFTFPGLYVKVPRSTEIRVRYNLPNGSVETRVLKGLDARKFLQAMDALKGTAFFHQTSPLKLDMAISRAKKKHGYDYSSMNLRSLLS